MSIELLNGQISGLKASIAELRDKEKLFIKSSTLAEQIEKARGTMDKIEAEIEEAKAKRKEHADKRVEILAAACQPLADEITKLLPHGKAVVNMTDGLFIGWEMESRRAPYQGLSGGEKACFDPALASALMKGKGLKVIILEAAEVDSEALPVMMEAIPKAYPEAQVILNTWAVPAETPAGWKVVELK